MLAARRAFGHSSVMQLSLIIATYNRKDALRRCLTSVFEQQGLGAFEVIVQDNGSGDGTAAMLRAEFPQVQLLASTSNLGAGVGRNAAAKQASGEWLVMLDDDEFWPHPHALAALLPYLAANAAHDAFVFTVITPEGEVFHEYIPRFDKQLMSDDSECACLLSGACAMRRSVFEALGGFWDLLSPYGFEDRELMFRFLAAGHRALWTRSIEIIHDKQEPTTCNSQWLSAMPVHHGWVALRHLPLRYVASYLVMGWGYYTIKALQHRQFAAWWSGLRRFVKHLQQVLALRSPLSPEVIAYCKRHSGRLRY